jgi:hypothetical protein
MSKKNAIGAVGGLMMALAFLGGALQGCGSSSSGGATDIASLCDQGCAKTVACLPAGSGVTVPECKTSCLQNAMTSAGAACTNQAAIISAANACLKMSACDAYIACATTIPDCAGGAGGAGGGTAN